MPAIMDDPASPTIFRLTGQPDGHSQLPSDIVPRHVTLRDRQTVATILPFASYHELPHSLLSYLCDQFNKEIEGGDTYPMTDTFTAEAFARYWFQNFGAVMLLGSLDGPADVARDKDWSRECLGSFYIKPNYPGRSSHVCNAGFLVTDASRNRGVGRLMGETYIDYAPRLGYTYSVFNLVYETNVASCRIWDALGFKRIGRVKGCGNLKSYPDRLIDAIIYGRDLAPGESEELVSEERFDKIKYYLKYNKYPNGADRAEKSRLRSAATHYKLLDDDKLMLKDKEVISDPVRQYDIARAVHVQHHGGINKTTATIAEKYHWSRIKETVSDVIRNCTECKELGKTPNPGGVKRTVGGGGGGGRGGQSSAATPSATSSAGGAGHDGMVSREPSGGLDVAAAAAVAAAVSPAPTTAASAVMTLEDHHPHGLMLSQPNPDSSSAGGYADPNDISSIAPPHTLRNASHSLHSHHSHDHHPQHHPHHHLHHAMLHDHHHHHHHDAYQPIDPQIINQPGDATDNVFEGYHHAADFQALLSATEGGESDAAAVDRDLEMLIEHQEDDDDDEDGGRHGDGRHGGGQQDGDVMMDRDGRDDKDGREMYGISFGGTG